MLFGKLLPREGNFFEMFNQHADRIVEAARAFSQLVANYGDVHLREQYNRDVDNAERAADRVTHDVNRMIHKTFITPIDREDIHMLASRLDDVIDLVDGTARRFAMLHISEVKPPARQLGDVLLRAADRIQQGVATMRKPGMVNQHAAEIKRLEEEGDAIYHEAVGALFAGSPDPLDVIRWKEMYDTLERAIDSCMGVAQVLQSISLKNA